MVPREPHAAFLAKGIEKSPESVHLESKSSRSSRVWRWWKAQSDITWQRAWAKMRERERETSGTLSCCVAGVPKFEAVQVGNPCG